MSGWQWNEAEKRFVQTSGVNTPSGEAVVIGPGENLGFINPSSSAGYVSQSANDYYFNTSDGNALYRAGAVGVPVAEFTRVPLPGGSVQMSTSDW